MNRGGLRERAILSALARSLEPSCQQDSCQYRSSRKIKEVLRGFPHRAQWRSCMSWTSVPYCISPSDLAAVLSLVAANGSYPSIELSTKPATRESTVVMTSMPGNGSYWELRFFLRQDGSQLVEAFELRHGCFLQLGRCCPAMEIHTLGPTGGPLSLLGRVQYPAYLCPHRRTHPGIVSWPPCTLAPPTHAQRPTVRTLNAPLGVSCYPQPPSYSWVAEGRK